MKILGIIPARYESSRFPGKPLADICGKPMIWWVYQQALKVKEFEEVLVATDSDIVVNACKSYGIKTILTGDHPTHVNRIYEVSEKVKSDYYVVVCGDEPIIEPEVIKTVLPRQGTINNDIQVSALCRYFTDPAEVIDPANIKVVTNENDECVLLSRAPIPFPYKSILFRYKKIIGVECYNKKALDFFASTPKGFLEKIEDVTLQRFLENKIHVQYRLVESESLSVDTPRDLEKIRQIISQRNAEK